MVSLPERIILFMLVAAGPFLLIVVPIGAFLTMSFFRMENQQIVHDLSLANYAAFFSSWTYVKTLLLTLWLCAEVTLIGLLIGYPIAYFIWRRSGRTRTILLLLFVLPLFMSYIVKIFTMRSMSFTGTGFESGKRIVALAARYGATSSLRVSMMPSETG